MYSEVTPYINIHSHLLPLLGIDTQIIQFSLIRSNQGVLILQGIGASSDIYIS